MMKALPIVQPFISAYPYHANLLSVLQAHDSDRTLPWILDNYLQLAMPDNPYDMKMDFYIFSPWKNCPFIYYQRIERVLILQNWPCFSDFVINCINNGNYVYTLADHYYLPPSDEFNKRHWVHDLFFHAYDLEERVFYVSDYFKDGIYKTVAVSFDSVSSAYNQLNVEMDWLHGVELIRYRGDRLHWFNPLVVKDKITHYLSGHNFALHNQHAGEYWKSGFMFGATVYDKIQTHYRLLRGHLSDMTDIRPFHVLYEHKKVLRHLVNYLEDNGLIPPKALSRIAEGLEQEAYVLRNLYLKLQLSKNDRLIKRLIASTEKIRITEGAMLTALIEHLKGSLNDEGNILKQSVITSSSDNPLEYRNVSNISDPDINRIYRSNDNPLFPVIVHFFWNQSQSINRIKMKTRFGQSRGITDFRFEVLLEDKWVTVLNHHDHVYCYDDFTIETLDEYVGPVESFREMRMTILKSNTKTNCFEINWLGLYKR